MKAEDRSAGNESLTEGVSGFTGYVKGVMLDLTQSVAGQASHAAPKQEEESSLFLNLDKQGHDLDSASRSSTRREENSLQFSQSRRGEGSPEVGSSKPNGIQIQALDVDQSIRMSARGSHPADNSVRALADFRNDLMQQNSSNANIGSTDDQMPKTDVPINVIARVRPQIPNERGHPVCIEVVDDSIVNGNKTQIVVRQGIGSAQKSNDQKMYGFEKVLDAESTQQQVFAQCDGLSLCNAFLNGQNCTIFVYGPTSTGKTFTMQGNAEDIIQGNNGPVGAGANLKSLAPSVNGSLDQSMIVPLDESVMTNDFDLKHSTPTKRKASHFTLAQKRAGAQTSQNRQASSSFHAPRGSKEDSSAHFTINLGPIVGGKPSIQKVARDMMIESRDKGIIQRVLDQIYERFAQRNDLKDNCEIKISFLEIYKEQVTDLLEGHVQIKPPKTGKDGSGRRGHSSSFFGINPTSAQQEGGDMMRENLESPQPSTSSVQSKRKKASTFYGEENLEDIVNKKRSRMEQRSSPNNNDLLNSQGPTHRSTLLHSRSGKTRDNSALGGKIQYNVKENAIKGVYVQNLCEITCKSAEQAYHCLLDGLMRKRMSQTCRNTSSSRSHTIFQVKMYMRPQNNNSLLLPQYRTEQTSEAKLVAKFSLIDLAGSERITEAEKNLERIDEARYINKSLSALGNVVAALRTQAKQASKELDQSVNSRRGTTTGYDSRRSSFHAPGGYNKGALAANFADMKHHNTSRRLSVYQERPSHLQHVPFRDSKLTHILKDCLGSNSFTHLIICLSPSYLCLAESISTLAFTKNAKAVRQNIVENVQFKSDMIQRNMASQPKRHAIGAPSGSMGSFSLLSQMAGGPGGNNEEDVAMLKEILGELGGQSLSSLSVRELFQLTLGTLRKFKENQQHSIKQVEQKCKNQIEELKAAMDKDLKNPRTIEIMTYAQTESEHISKTKNSFHEPFEKVSQATPTYKQSGIGPLIAPQAEISLNQPLQTTARDATLKSISEENLSACVTSPTDLYNSKPSALINTGNHLALAKRRSLLELPQSEMQNIPKNKHASTTSILTFAGAFQGHAAPESSHNIFGKEGSAAFGGLSGLGGLKPKSRESDMNIELMLAGVKRGEHQSSESFTQRQTKEQKDAKIDPSNDASQQILDTEPGEIVDETDTCGCSHNNKSTIGTVRASIIPAHNLRRLQQVTEFTSMKSVIQKHLKNFIRRRIIINSLMSAPAPTKGPHGKHKRQKSSDAAHNRVLSNDSKVKRVARSTARLGEQKQNRLEPQQFLSQCKQMDSQAANLEVPHPFKHGKTAKQFLDEVEAELESNNEEAGLCEENPEHQRANFMQNDQFTNIEMAGMQYFMPKLLKSQSCPSQLAEQKKGSGSPDLSPLDQGLPNRDDEPTPLQVHRHVIEPVPDKSIPKASTNNEPESMHEIISDIYSSSSNEFQETNDVVQSYQSTPVKHQNSNKQSPLTKLNLCGAQGKQPLSSSQRDLLKSKVATKTSISPMKGSSMMPRFEQSQAGDKPNLFEYSRFSGSNSLQSQSLAQSQSQKFINYQGKARGEPKQYYRGAASGGLGSGQGHIKVIQIRQDQVMGQSGGPQPYYERSNSRRSKESSRCRLSQGKQGGGGIIGSASRTSVQSNDIVVVEEVQDHEISSQAFQSMRDSNNNVVSSIRTDSVQNFKGMGPLIEDSSKVPQHSGSLIEPKQRYQMKDAIPASLSSIHQQDVNSTSKYSTLFTPKKANSNLDSNMNNTTQPQNAKNQQRAAQKTLISDLNKAHSHMAGVPSSQRGQTSQVNVSKLTGPKDYQRPTYQIPEQLSARKASYSFHSASSARPLPRHISASANAYKAPYKVPKLANTYSLQQPVEMHQQSTTSAILNRPASFAFPGMSKTLSRVSKGGTEARQGPAHVSHSASKHQYAGGSSFYSSQAQQVPQQQSYKRDGFISHNMSHQAPHKGNVSVLSATPSSMLLRSAASSASKSLQGKYPTTQHASSVRHSPFKPNKPGASTCKPSKPLAGGQLAQKY